jgi:D-serine deaminase-like pyridoxal phosphate-dependent protein
MRYAEIDTPALVVDLDQVDRNLRRIQAVADQAGVKLRPHTKTHKSTYFAKRQLELGARGLTCAKLGEAEVLADAGCDDILIAYPIIGPLKLARLGRLAQRLRRLIVSLDSLEVAAGLSALGEQLGRPIEVYAEVDTGLARVGRTPGEDALAFCQSLDSFPGIRLSGLMSHAGPTWKAGSEAEILAFARQEVAAMVAVKEGLGRPDIEISVGATPIAHLVAQTPGVTEMRPGTYIFGDRNLIGLGLTTEDECALRVLTTVVSHPTADRAVVDAGSKSLAMDPHREGGHGWVVGRPDLRVDRLSEEHGVLTMAPGTPIKVGDRLEIIPNHVCPAVNLFDQMWGVRAGKVIGPIPIEGRGKNT